MNPLPAGVALAVGAAVPVVVVGWAIMFAVEAARRGARWALGHLRFMRGVFLTALGLALVACLVVRPVWVGLAAAYPVAVALLLTTGRSRQLALVDRQVGLGDIDPSTQTRVLARLRQGLWVVGAVALTIGATLWSIGVAQGWIVAVLAPVALAAIVRSRASGLGGNPPPSL